MSPRYQDALLDADDLLRYEPTEKRIRAMAGDSVVADTTRAMLVWEPRRVVPSYAVPVEDLQGDLVPLSADASSGSTEIKVLHPGIPFGVHSSEGDAFSIRLGDDVREDAAFRPADPDLAGYAVLDFGAFDTWYEEDEPIVGHPRSPYHRVDIRQSSRHVRIELKGEVLAESAQPLLVFETSLPVRFYLARDGMRAELHPSDRRTYCAYKGEASYFSVEVNGRMRPDIAWSYEQPLQGAEALSGLVAFFDERVDVVLDGERRERPRTALSAAILAEAGVS